MRRLLVAALLLAVACKKAPADKSSTAAPLAPVAGLEMMPYIEAGASYQTIGPAGWQVREDDALGPSTTFFGPGTAKYPRSVSIHISRYPNTVDKSTEPRTYYEGVALIPAMKIVSPYAATTVGAKAVEHYALEAPSRRLHERKVLYHSREDIAIIRIPGGFYQITHTAPVEIYRQTYPIFEAVVANFKLGPGHAANTP